MFLRGNISLQYLLEILRPVEVIIITISTNDSYILTRVINLYIYNAMLIEVSNNIQTNSS